MQIENYFARVVKFNYVTFFAISLALFPNRQVVSSSLVCLVFLILFVFPVISNVVISCSALNVLSVCYMTFILATTGKVM